MTDDELISFAPVAVLIALAVRYEGLATVLVIGAVLAAVLVAALAGLCLWRRWRSPA